jgi:2-dehydropantoate 2-reductase
VALSGMRDFMAEAGREALRTAIAVGVTPRPIFGMADADVEDPDRYVDQLFDEVLHHFTLPETRTTVLQDWMKGRRSEVDQINGLVVDEQSRLGGAAPANAVTVRLAHLVEDDRLAAHPRNVEQLLLGLAAHS